MFVLKGETTEILSSQRGSTRRIFLPGWLLL
jgi:hypothetical protein